MAREMLKLRKGDSAMMIKTDGSMELAGVEDKPLVNEKGEMSPIILFAAAWGRKDDNVMRVLIENFKQAVRDGQFGFEAKRDILEQERIMSESTASGAVTMDSSSGAVTMDSSSGAVTTEQVKPKLIPTQSAEEYARGKQQEAVLESYAEAGRNPDPRAVAQREKMLKGAKVISTKSFDKHVQPALPVEQTLAYQNATPEEQALMKQNQDNPTKPEGYNPSNINESDKVVEAQTVGNVTIEEGVPNENK